LRVQHTHEVFVDCTLDRVSPHRAVSWSGTANSVMWRESAGLS
jgi:hypothetical protein